MFVSIYVASPRSRGMTTSAGSYNLNLYKQEMNLEDLSTITVLKIVVHDSENGSRHTKIDKTLTVTLMPQDLEKIFSAAISSGVYRLPEFDKILSLIEQLKTTAESLTEQVEKPQKKIRRKPK